MKKLKSNIVPISNQTNNLYKLKSVSYTFNETSLKSSNSLVQTQTMDPNKIVSELKPTDNRIHYGFIAQEVKEIYPELVYEDDEGILGIDYISFIPLLIEELKQQNEIIEKLKQEVALLKSTSNVPSVNYESAKLGSLYQNYPNPFNESTTIKINLSENVNSAQLCIYDLNGKQIKNYPVQQRNDVDIVINGSELQPGMYLYSLVADKKFIDTKTLILTE